MTVIVERAIEAARSRQLDALWGVLSPREKAEAIYKEMRRLDAEQGRVVHTYWVMRPPKLSQHPQRTQ